MTNFTLDQNKLNYSEVFTNAESGNQQLRYKVGDKLIEENKMLVRMLRTIIYTKNNIKYEITRKEHVRRLRPSKRDLLLA